MPAWFPGIASAFVTLLAVNVSTPTSLIIPTELRYLKRRPGSNITTSVHENTILGLTKKHRRCLRHWLQLLNGNRIASCGKYVEEL